MVYFILNNYTFFYIRTRIIRVRRALLMCDMIQQFKDEEIMASILTFIMVDQRGEDEQGEDVGGVYRDAIGSFWQEFYDSCLGEAERVPNLRHDFQSAEWKAIARVIVKGYLDLGYFPYMLSKAFMASAFFNESAVSENVLLHSFKPLCCQR